MTAAHAVDDRSSSEVAQDPELRAIRARMIDRFGLAPSFFLLARAAPAIMRAQFEMAEFAYFDSPLPASFKERLFTYLSRFCAIPYCMARHCGFLVGLGHVAGHAEIPSTAVADVLTMLKRPFPTATARARLLADLKAQSALESWPERSADIEDRVFMAAAVTFVMPIESHELISELRRVLGRVSYEYLMLFLAFVRFAHFWTETHPDLELERDIGELLAEQRELASWITGYQSIVGDELVTRVRTDLRELEALRGSISALELGVSALREEVDAGAQAADAGRQAKIGFIAMISHELRTPLNAIIGYADLLDLGTAGELPSQASAYVGRIRLTARYQRELIEQILTFASIDAGHDSVVVEHVAPAEICAEVTAVITPLAEAKGLTFSVDATTAPAIVQTDPGKLRQILLNLLGNAVKFTDAGGVALRMLVRDGAFTCIVSDTGPGIPERDRDRIFEPFTQGDASHKRAHGGTGLGLAIVRRLTDALHGTVSVDGAQGQGATFTVALPRAASAP